MRATIQVDLNVLPDDSADAIASYVRSALLDWGLEIDGNVRVSVEAEPNSMWCDACGCEHIGKRAFDGTLLIGCPKMGRDEYRFVNHSDRPNTPEELDRAQQYLDMERMRAIVPGAGVDLARRVMQWPNGWKVG